MSNPRLTRNIKIASPVRLEQLSFSYSTKPGEEHKLGFIDLFDKHFKDRDAMAITEASEGKPWARWFYNLINEAFLSAEVGLQYNRVIKGQTLSERASLLRGIEAEISGILENLTGQSDPELQRSSKISEAFWHYLTLVADEEFSPGDAFAALLKFRSMLQGAATAMADAAKDEEQHPEQPAIRAPRQGRPPNIHKDILYRELMGAWQKATGSVPTLKIDIEGFADCPFCQFFESYFGNSLTAESIAAHCSRLRQTKQ